jgi:hypothetical protein
MIQATLGSGKNIPTMLVREFDEKNQEVFPQGERGGQDVFCNNSCGRHVRQTRSIMAS